MSFFTRSCRKIAVPVVAAFAVIGFAGLTTTMYGGAATSATPSTLLPPASPFLSGTLIHPGHPGGGGGGGHGSCTTTLPSANGVAYTPAEIRTAYSYSSAPGAGETVAIIDAYGSPSLSSDLACFDQTFGLPTPNLHIVQPFGKVHGKNTGWGIETSLDVEWAHAMARPPRSA